MAITTQGLVLKYRTKGSDGNYEEFEIKSFPDMRTAPNMIECTTLGDTAQQYVEGVKPLAAMEFTANYDNAKFAALKTLEGTEMEYLLTNTETVNFSWTGKHTVIVVGGGVNAVLDMKLSIMPSSIIE